MTDRHPRYVTIHQTRFDGNTIMASYVLDSWYSWREVFTVRSGRAHIARASAEQVAARWNAEHDAWLLDEVAA